MEASELRIGNFVKEKNAQYKTDNGFTQILATGIYQFNLGSLELDPLPLTEEWLLKFGGIHETGGMYFFGNVGILHYRRENEFSLMNYNYKKGQIYTTIKYVHQLQNLYFALTGKELEYEQN
jgi:hypothetical protein